MPGRFLAYILVYISNLIIILAVIGLGHSLKGIRSQSEAIELQEEYNERMKQLLSRYQLKLSDPMPDERTREVLENSLRRGLE